MVRWLLVTPASAPVVPDCGGGGEDKGRRSASLRSYQGVDGECEGMGVGGGGGGRLKTRNTNK